MTADQISRIAIIGAGTMGARIAFQCLLHGKNVTIYDAHADALLRATEENRVWLREKMGSEAAAAALSRLHPCTNLAECVGKTQLVIEAVPENLELKRQLFREIDCLAPAGTLIATNSSSLPSSQLAGVTGRPELVFNVNFNDPLENEYLVEIMGHAGTARETLAAGEAFLNSIGMVPILTRAEIMGFTFNRIWRAIKREALHLVGDGCSRFEDIDRAWMLTFGSDRGPFGRMDEIGLDVVRDIELQYYRNSGEERDHPPAFLDELIDQGRLGVKSGQGFYTYPNPEYKRPGWLYRQPPWTPDRYIQVVQSRLPRQNGDKASR